MKIKEWPINPISGEPETERDVLMELIIRAPMPPDMKIRLARSLPPQEAFSPVRLVPLRGLGPSA